MFRTSLVLRENLCLTFVLKLDVQAPVHKLECRPSMASSNQSLPMILDESYESDLEKIVTAKQISRKANGNVPEGFSDNFESYFNSAKSTSTNDVIQKYDEEASTSFEKDISSNTNEAAIKEKERRFEYAKNQANTNDNNFNNNNNIHGKRKENSEKVGKRGCRYFSLFMLRPFTSFLTHPCLCYSFMQEDSLRKDKFFYPDFSFTSFGVVRAIITLPKIIQHYSFEGSSRGPKPPIKLSWGHPLLIYSKNFLLAATYIEDARYGRTLDYLTDKEALQCYRRYSNPYMSWATIIVMWLLLSLALFEDPAVPGIGLPYWATIIMEFACLAVILFRMMQLSSFVPRRSLITDPKNIMVALTIVVTLIDMVIYIGMIESSAKNQAIRVSRALRPLFFINMNESRQVRRAFRNIRNTVPEIFSVLVLFIFSISLFTLLAFKFFQFRELTYRGGEEYFTNYWDSFFDLYVLVTTANSPDVMMPAYDESTWFALFFIAYIIVNTYIFMNLFLAVIYNSYRTHLKTEIRASVFWKRKKLELAFEILKESEDNPVITYLTWKEVMESMSRPPTFSKMSLYWAVLNHEKDENRDITECVIEKDDFLLTANLLNVYIVEGTHSVNIFAKLAPEIYFSKPSRWLRKAVSHVAFGYLFDVLIIANAICIGLDYETTEWFFLSIFLLEIILKMYTLGPREYFSRDRLWNWFDFTIIMAAFIATVIEASLSELYGFPQEALDFLMVLRCLRLVKIVSTVERFHVIVMTVLNIAPSLIIYGGVLLMIYYLFAIIGMEAFGGKISFINDGTPAIENMCGNIRLKNSEFLRVGYCNNNFNDILHSLVTLVELTVVNQWHIITLGYTLVTSKAARLYFIAFHLTVVILVMNIIVAFVLEAFILEYSLGQTDIESQVEKTIESLGLMANANVTTANHDRTHMINPENDTGDTPHYQGRAHARHEDGPRHRFKINKGHKNVEVLLERMFEDKLVHSNETTVSRNESAITLTFDDVTETSLSV